MKTEVVLPRTTEEQAQRVASFLNQARLVKATEGNRYVVLDVYPHCNTKRVVLLGGRL